ncbi:MAG: 30S ribosomal protein S2 [Chloroflexota bacterium]
MAIISMKALLESGVHFGHRTHRWHPYMKPYIFTARKDIHIIDLQQTVEALEEAYEIVRDTVAEGGTVLFVGTKRQAQEAIMMEAKRCGMPYVTGRWLGGTLTNHRTIREGINELQHLEKMRDTGEFERLTKKEALLLQRKIDLLEARIGGIREMVELPNLLFIVDVRREETAVHEANLLDIPIVALVDTNCDPRNIDYVIPSNDDAIRAIKLLVGKIADAVLEGKGLRKEEEIERAEVIALKEELAEELELTDEELLGEATLAKIGSRIAIEEFEEGVEVGDEVEETASKQKGGKKVKAKAVESDEDEIESASAEEQPVSEG